MVGEIIRKGEKRIFMFPSTIYKILSMAELHLLFNLVRKSTMPIRL